ncbi:vacuolar aminopeptidase 1 [Friedmanniomyces endolithicus]|uniref:Vacuolar aminopeptidase 1 n=1 Tax=Friedmanniomyces endolithicus TaxID=329885 RepID=A0AAN6FLI7_9PEZI|nr:vacuolar aminopeptidase 1 [Friedmanniomyces endolithicus]KAK0297895.1 vacuolar aminopeptidase 1 [Friedmanniomyces endolithicus]KAK0319909.1 vacuolar aminopeptidase 1 [Friedmanniomyces endolithicus]KAK1018461.1 vacuolar aminopeptidase 1 [Friedmanniomyces endolithicus]
MVKNTPSMSSLHDAMDDLKVSPPSIQARINSLGKSLQQMPQTPPESNVNLNQPTQLVGTDAYTKLLMNRIATGTANAEEKEQWQQHVAAVKARPNTQEGLHRAQWEQRVAAVQAQSPHIMMMGLDHMPSSPVQSTSTIKQQGPADQKWQDPSGSLEPDFTTRAPFGPTNHALQDYSMQMMLLEQENKRRLGKARAEHDCTMREDSIPEHVWPQPVSPHQMREEHMHSERGSAEPGSTPQALFGSTGHERKDFELQLMLLEMQNKKRLAMARAEQDAVVRESAGAVRVVHSERATRQNAAKYTGPFCRFLTENPTVFHAVDAVKRQLVGAGFTELSERDSWDLKTGGSYFVERNGSAMIAFTVGAGYEAGNGAAILAGHVDALTAKLKPISQVPNKAGYVQLGIAPYAGAPNATWWDRDLGIGGRVLVKEGDKIVTKLVKLDWPIARIPTLAPHFGAAANGPFNPETQMTPIIGLDGTDSSPFEHAEPFSNPPLVYGAHDGANAFIQTQPPRLVKAIGNALGLRADTYSSMVNWELELFDTQKATVGGLSKEFIFAGRIDDKLCSWAAIQALVETKADATQSSLLHVVGLFDDEEIGSGLRQGARSNFLPSVLERAVATFTHSQGPPSDIMGRTYANSFLVSSDVIHAVNPNFLGAYLENHAPHLNVGIVVSADSNGHMTTDAVSTAILKRCADKVGAKLQVFQIRNDSRSGGTVGPMLSSMTGIRAVDAGIPQLSMHSIRATTGSLDPGLGVLMFKGFLGGFEEVDREFRE